MSPRKLEPPSLPCHVTPRLGFTLSSCELASPIESVRLRTPRATPIQYRASLTVTPSFSFSPSQIVVLGAGLTGTSSAARKRERSERVARRLERAVRLRGYAIGRHEN
jgi:hypothetical protein